MAASKRSYSPARWVVVLGSTIAAASFWTAVVSKPDVVASAPPPTQVVQNTSSTSRGFSPLGGQQSRGQVTPQQPQQPRSSAAPRLRTRGS